MIRVFKRMLYVILMTLFSNKKKYILCRYFHDVNFGKNVRITGFPRWGTESYLISIGDNVTITQDVVFHTHDGGVHVLRDRNPGLNVFGGITIGNNVFIGSNVIILPGVKVGNNVVIGTGSVVSKNIPDGVVAVGVPAKAIKTLEEYETSAIAKGILVPKSLKGKKRKLFIVQHLSNWQQQST